MSIHIKFTFVPFSRQSAEFERQSEKWAETKRNLEDQFHTVQNELRNQEMAVSAKQKGKKMPKKINQVKKRDKDIDSISLS